MSPVSTMGLGINQRTGAVERYQPPRVVEEGGGGGGPPEHLTQAQQSSGNGTNWAALTIPSGTWLCWVEATGVAAGAGVYSAQLTGLGTAFTTNMQSGNLYAGASPPVQLTFATSTTLTVTTVNPWQMNLVTNALRIG